MTEREFLVSYAKELEAWSGTEFTQGHNVEAFDQLTNNFLDDHHRTYREVHIPRRTQSDDDIIKQALNITLNKFITYLDVPLDDDYLKAKIESYIQETFKR